MRRRSKASSKLTKARSRKAEVSERRTAPVAGGRSSDTGQEAEIARLTRELSEAQEQQTATAEVLKIISTSPTELQPVLEIVVRSAARFCSADDVTIFELDGQYLRIAAHWGVIPQEIGVRFPCVRGQVAGRAVLERKPVHVIDLQAEAKEFPEGSAFARRLGHRTTAGVPLLREGVAVGTIMLRRTEVSPFTDKQLALLQTFAAQAVIAIENARLLNELRESLQQQTATADVLKVISRSTFDLQTVLNTLVESAAQLCDADSAAIYRPAEEGVYRHQATYGYSSEYIDYMRLHPLTPNRGSVLGRAVLEQQVIHVEDVLADPNYQLKEQRAIGGYRTTLGVPLMREGTSIGVILLSRSVVKPFTDKQIELVTTFADQAVIAIENVRLFEAEQQRTRELSESLEQQTATSEVLAVISKSPADLKPVFEAMLENATRICEAKFGSLFRFDGKAFHLVAEVRTPPELAEAQRQLLRTGPTPGGLFDRAVRTKQVIHSADATKDAAVGLAAKFGGARSTICVPMLKDDELIGAILIYRQEVRPFTDKQIALLQNFAAQAVIAEFDGGNGDRFAVEIRWLRAQVSNVNHLSPAGSAGNRQCGTRVNNGADLKLLPECHRDAVSRDHPKAAILAKPQVAEFGVA